MKKFLIIFLLVVGFIGCSEKKISKFESERFLFGTYIRITVYDRDEKLAKNSMEEAFKEIERIDNKFNSKVSSSIIGKLNNLPGEKIQLDEEGVYLFNEVKKIYALSEGRYDITIAPLLKAWGFGQLENINIPSDETIKEAQEKVDFSKVKLEGNILSFEAPVEEIDTGSFLKGYAVERAKLKMKELGITSAFITSVSSIDVIGNKPENRPWRIGVQNPDAPEEIIGIVELNDEGMGVSGDYQTYVEIDGKRYHHILDKKTGYPVADKRMVLVVCDDAFMADMYSTAFFLMPIEKIIDYVESSKNMKVLVVDKDMKIYKSKNLEIFQK